MKHWTTEDWIEGSTCEKGVYWREADGGDHRIEVSEGEPFRAYGLRGDADGSLSVVGTGDGDAWRTGDGDGYALRDGTGDGDAWRDGDGTGYAWRHGDGDGDAMRLGDGTGDACQGAEDISGAIPRRPMPHWQLPWANSFRQNVQGSGVFATPDLVPARVRATASAFPPTRLAQPMRDCAHCPSSVTRSA